MLRRLFRKKSPSSIDNIDSLLTFLPILESGKLKRAPGYRKKHNRDQPEIEQLRDVLRNSPLVGGTEWVMLPPSMLILLLREEYAPVLTMSASEIKLLLTILSRHDRLAEGILLPAICQRGLMTVTLQRLKTLHEAGEIA